ncbi:hypothetical protein [Brevibacterium album]|uniref:hypothetical protein n=1 Tax=Brevibacterium album TaxID=417948 RepID=UPI0004010A19|nr:hypothetical protein [Brevibacterium album]
MAVHDYKFPGGWNHKIFGNTWKVNDDGSWYLPERTLGWGILGWCSAYLLNDQGKQWRFTPEQARFVLWWYAVDDRGRFIYRKGVLQRLKGHGKDPLAAALALVELCGPSQFSGWDSAGQPLGSSHPNAYVTVSAVSESQTRTTSDVLQWMVSDRLKNDYGLNVGIERVTANGGRAQLVFSASSYKSIEGKRPTFSILNEIQHWTASTQGHKMYETLDGNLTKSPNGVARMLAITNAYQPGEDSVGEIMRHAYLDQVDYDRKFPGKRIGATMYYDSLEADPAAPLEPEIIMQIVAEIRGDSKWLDPESIVGRFMDRSVPTSHNRRMFYNQVVAKEDALYEEADWDSSRVDAGELLPRTEVVLGFDGGKTDDATALVAKRVSDGVVFPIMIWEKPPSNVDDDWQIDRRQVDSYIHWCFKTFDVLAFYADVAEWESYIDSWSEAYRSRLVIRASSRHAIGWDMRGGQEKITRANEALMTAVFESRALLEEGAPEAELPFKHNGNRVLRRHALNARRRENRWGITFGKESRESPLKVDAYAAVLLAEMAYRDLKESGKAKRRQPAKVIAY